MFVPSFGWMWQPGMWNSFVAVPRYTPTTLTRVTTLTPPATGTMKTVTVGKVSTSSLLSSRMTVNSGSAGMGIARGSVNNLGHVNQEVSKRGSAELRPAPAFSATPAARSASPTFGPARSSSSMPSSMGHSAPASHSSGGGSSHH